MVSIQLAKIERAVRVELHTSSRLWSLWHNEDRIVSRNGFKTNIRVPVVMRLSLFAVVQLLAIFGTDAVDMIVLFQTFPGAVEDGMNMESALLWSSRKLAQSKSNLLQHLIIYIVLGTEDYNATLRDFRGWSVVVTRSSVQDTH